METEIYLKTNNNSPPSSLPKKWAGGGVLGSVEEDESPPASPPPVERGRRKSWHFTKEKESKRARRKGSLLPPTGKYTKEKRSSWWNIFVPENSGGSRSRRASGVDLPTALPQSSAHPRRASEIHIPPIPWLRSKSRSVDHGTTAPFDLDALRSKVEGRFQSLDKLTKNGKDLRIAE